MEIRRSLQALLVILGMSVAPASFASDEEVLTTMLHEFLAGASAGSIEAHETFWHDKLIYTSSSGSRTDKAAILESVGGAPPPSDEGPSVVYTAENIDIRIYGDTAIVAFRLVGTPQGADAGGPVNEYFNTGTFLRGDDGWSVIAWQATRIPPPEDTS